MRLMVIAALLTVSALATASHANLIANGDFENDVIGVQSNYTLSPDDITPAATWDVTTNPSLIHHVACSYTDHTTGTGLMMAINGDTGQGVPWKQTVIVQPNRTYRFSMWSSVWYPGTVSLALRINGLDVGTSFATASSCGIWQEHTQTWSSGAAASAFIEVVNLSTGHSGNDFAFDDISFVKINPPLQGDLNGDAAVNDTDFAILAAHFGIGTGMTLADGDITGDGAVNDSDFAILAANFGAQYAPDMASIPEPATLAVLVISTGVLGRTRGKP